MGQLLGIVLPLALGAAISPTIIAVQLLMLSRKTSPVGRAWAVAAGCAVILAIFAVIALLVAGTTGKSGSRSEARGIVKLVAAVLLLVLGVRALRRPPQPAKPERPGAHSVAAAFVIGAGLMLTNISSIALFFPAMHEIGTSRVALDGKVGAIALLYVITLVPAVVPPLIVTVAGARAASPLERLNHFFLDHRAAISAAICFGFAALLTVTGIAALV